MVLILHVQCFLSGGEYSGLKNRYLDSRNPYSFSFDTQSLWLVLDLRADKRLSAPSHTYRATDAQTWSGRHMSVEVRTRHFLTGLRLHAEHCWHGEPMPNGRRGWRAGCPTALRGVEQGRARSEPRTVCQETTHDQN